MAAPAEWVMVVALLVAILANIVLLFDPNSPASQDSWQMPMLVALLWTVALWIKDTGGTHAQRETDQHTRELRGPSSPRVQRGELRDFAYQRSE